MGIPGSVKLRLAILCLALGFLLHVICFASPYWFSDEGIHGGLWLLCIDSTGCDSTPDSVPGVFHFVQAAEAIALIFGLLSIGAVVWMMLSPSIYRVQICRSLTSAAGIISLIGVVTFLARITDDKQWASYLEIPAGLLLTGAGILFWLEARTMNSEYQSVS